MEKVNALVEKVKAKYNSLSTKHQRYVQVVGGFIVLCILVTVVG